MAYTRVVCASMHVLFPVRKFLLCAIAFVLGKLRLFRKIADQSRAGSHFNSQNTHSQFVSQLATRILPVPSYLRAVRRDGATYQIWFRLPVRNPNPKTDPNPKSNNNLCSTKRHPNKVQHSVICKSYFRWAGGGYTKGLYRKSAILISRILHMVNSDPLTMNVVLGVTV